MNCNFTLSFFLTYIFFFFEVVVKIFDNFWEPDSPLSKLTVNSLLMFYFVHCKKCDLKNVNGACFYFCSLIALSIPKIYFWPAKTRKNPKFLEMHTCLWPGAQRCFGQKWRKLATPSLLLHCIDGYSCLRYWTEIFSSLFHVSDWSLLVVYSDVKACNWIPKLIWRRLVFFGVLYQNMPRIVDFISEWTEIWTRCSFNFHF